MLLILPVYVCLPLNKVKGSHAKNYYCINHNLLLFSKILQDWAFAIKANFFAKLLKYALTISEKSRLYKIMQNVARRG